MSNPERRPRPALVLDPSLPPPFRMQPMELNIESVSKTYSNGVQALKDVTLTIPAGMYGLLGPNGAGKSTLMRILATLQEADSGSVTLGDPSQGSGQRIDVLRQKDEVRQDTRLPAAGVRRLSEGERRGAARSLRAAQGHRRATRAQGGRRGAAPAGEPVGGPQAEAGRLLGRHAAALRRRRRVVRQPEAHDRGRAHGRTRSRPSACASSTC